MTGYIMVHLKGERKRLVKKARGPSRSSYLYGARRGVLYSTLSQDKAETDDMFVNNTTGDKVRLIEHGTEATFEPWEGGEAKTVPSYEFFSSHREATPEEVGKMEATAKKATEKEPTKKADEKEPVK